MLFGSQTVLLCIIFCCWVLMCDKLITFHVTGNYFYLVAGEKKTTTTTTTKAAARINCKQSQLVTGVMFELRSVHLFGCMIRAYGLFAFTFLFNYITFYYISEETGKEHL